MANVSDIIDYYVNLLIVQYHNQPKAQATIKLLATEMLASGILLDIQNAYNLDTAVGVQLDVLGKYAGVDRFYSLLDLENYFSLETYDETPPTSPPRYGFTDYADFASFQFNGTLTYGAIIAANNSLIDSDFRALIKLVISINYSNFSHQSIDQLIFDAFGNSVRPENNGNMSMVYFITPPLTALMNAILFKRILPHPIGVNALAVTNVNNEMFALSDYSGYESPFGYGFSTYDNYATLPGEVLTYSQIAEV
jgi:hypothetical protein